MIRSRCNVRSRFSISRSPTSSLAPSLVLALCLALAPLSGCKTQQPDTSPPPSSGQEYIGTANMEQDGTLILWLRGEDASGDVVGHATFTYPPNHPEYKDVLAHLGGMSPGETKGVPPWPEER